MRQIFDERDFVGEVEAAAKGMSFVAPSCDGHDLEAMIAELKVVIPEPQKIYASHSLMPNLLSISKSVRAMLGLKLAEVGIFSGQNEVLICLEEEVPASISGLAAKLQVRPSTMSKMVDGLMAAGLLTRTRSKEDSRRAMVQLTARGLDARTKVMLIHERLEAELRKEIDPDNLNAVLENLNLVVELLHGRLSRLR